MQHAEGSHGFSCVAITGKTSSFLSLWFYEPAPKKWRSCVPRSVRDKLTIVEQLEWHSPEASNLISLCPWPWSTAVAKCIEGQKQFRRGVMSAERRRLPESAEVIFYHRKRGRHFQLHHSGSLAPLHAHTTPVTPTHVTLLQIKSFNSFQNQDVAVTECSCTILSNWGSLRFQRKWST